MEALLATLAMVALIVGGLVLFARAWPRDPGAPGVGGYRARLHGTRDAGSDPSAAPGIREDDDAHWDWPDDRRDPDRTDHT